jgi:hypothetical protein
VSLRAPPVQHAPHNAMSDAGEIERFHDRCSDLMRELLDELATTPDRPRPFPAIEDALGWPRRRIASVLGGVSHMRHTEFGGRRPYRFHDERNAASGRWELWMDASQAAAVRAQSGYSSLRQARGSSGSGFGVRASRNE